MTRSLIAPTIALFAFITAFTIGHGIKIPLPEIDKQQEMFTPSAEMLRIAGLGLNRLWADILWIHTLMESDTDHYKNKDLGSWMYLRFLTISKLDPRFYENYYYGGQYLMIVKDDLLGAEVLLLKATEFFPEDVGINWQLGFLNAIERNNPKAALPFFDRIRNKPDRPPSFDSLYTKMASGVAGAQAALEYAESVWKTHPKGSIFSNRLWEQMYALRAEIDIDCLEKSKAGCSKIDLEGNPYLFDKGRWRSVRPPVNMKWRMRSNE